jgi:hypothetical protein
MNQHDHGAVKEKERLRSRWTAQLYLEAERITYQFRLKLSPAVVRIGDFSEPLARWNPAIRALEFSFGFIYAEAWEVVVEVLKHEMAHQIVDEIFRQNCGHGPYFKKAAAMLGLQSWAAVACIDLPRLALLKQRSRQLSPEQQRLMSRVHKLLALASSANQCEAELAMQKVHELYAGYQLSLLQELVKPDFISILIPSRQKRMATYQSLIASLLVKFFHVQVIHTSSYHALDCTEYKTLELCGVPHQVEMAEYVYHFLNERARAFWREHQKEQRQHPLSKKGQRPQAFYQGVIAGFTDKLQEQQERREAAATIATLQRTAAPQPTARATALMRAQEERRLEEFVRSRHPRLHNCRVGRGGSSASLYAAGKKKGQQLVLHRPLKREGASSLFYLK